jgi:hypothetical protein
MGAGSCCSMIIRMWRCCGYQQLLLQGLWVLVVVAGMLLGGAECKSKNHYGVPLTSVLVEVDASAPIATTDQVFLCATLDWWPPDKCDYGACSWGTDSILNIVSQSSPKSLLSVSSSSSSGSLKIFSWAVICADHCKMFAKAGGVPSYHQVWITHFQSKLLLAPASLFLLCLQKQSEQACLMCEIMCCDFVCFAGPYKPTLGDNSHRYLLLFLLLLLLLSLLVHW